MYKTRGDGVAQLVFLGAAFVAAELRLKVRQEHLRDEITATAYAGLAEGGLEVLLDGVSETTSWSAN